MIAPHITLFGVGSSGRGSECGRAPAAEKASFSFICVRVSVDGTRCVFISSGSGSRPPARLSSAGPSAAPSFPLSELSRSVRQLFWNIGRRALKVLHMLPLGPAWHLFDRIRWVFLLSSQPHWPERQIGNDLAVYLSLVLFFPSRAGLFTATRLTIFSDFFSLTCYK